MSKKLVGLLILLLAHLSLAGSPEPQSTTQAAELWTVAENNPIIQVYVGKTNSDGTELVFELATMHFSSNQTLYGCIFVSGQIAYLKEYNNEDNYVRAVVKLPADDPELVMYSGVIKAVELIDPHDHAALWKAFIKSSYKPFRAKLSHLPQWYVTNPIKAKKITATSPAATTQQAPPSTTSAPATPAASSYPYLNPEQLFQKVKRPLFHQLAIRPGFIPDWVLRLVANQ